MGISAPPPANVDLVGSYARRRGTEVELVLWEPTEALGATAMVLRRAGVDVDGSVALVEDERGRRLVCRAPQARLTDGQWSLHLVDTDEEPHRVAARLLVQGRRPVVLLWGGKAPASTAPRAKASGDVKTRVVRAGGSVLDSALKALPAERAVTVRSALRRTARQVLK